MSVTLAVCVFVGAVWTAVDAIAHTGKPPRVSFDGIHGPSLAIEQVLAFTLVGVMAGSGAFLGALVRHSVRHAQFRWYLLIGVTNVLFVGLVITATELVLNYGGVTLARSWRGTLDVAMCVLPPVIATWFLMGVENRRVSAYA